MRYLICFFVSFFALVFAVSKAETCPPNSYTDTLESATCTWSQSEPGQSDVSFDNEKKEFSYDLDGVRTEIINRVWRRCHGRGYAHEKIKRTQNILKKFVQVEEGHTDFTLIREVRAFLKRTKNGSCE